MARWLGALRRVIADSIWYVGIVAVPPIAGIWFVGGWILQRASWADGVAGILLILQLPAMVWAEIVRERRRIEAATPPLKWFNPTWVAGAFLLGAGIIARLG